MKNILLYTLVLLLSASCNTKKSTQSSTEKVDNINIHPIFHGSLVLEWKGKAVFIDPYGGAERFTPFGKPDLVLITHPHGDHLNKETLEGLDLNNATLIAPKAVTEKLGDITFSKIMPLANGEQQSFRGINIEAVPMYNLPETDDSRHPKGWGNGYVLSMDKKRLYISGDTEDIEEMRKLNDIDIAFVCMNLPYTMAIEPAADAVLEFQPDIVTPTTSATAMAPSVMWSNSNPLWRMER